MCTNTCYERPLSDQLHLWLPLTNNQAAQCLFGSSWRSSLYNNFRPHSLPTKPMQLANRSRPATPMSFRKSVSPSLSNDAASAPPSPPGAMSHRQHHSVCSDQPAKTHPMGILWLHLPTRFIVLPGNCLIPPCLFGNQLAHCHPWEKSLAICLLSAPCCRRRPTRPLVEPVIDPTSKICCPVCLLGSYSCPGDPPGQPHAFSVTRSLTATAIKQTAIHLLTKCTCATQLLFGPGLSWVFAAYPWFSDPVYIIGFIALLFEICILLVYRDISSFWFLVFALCAYVLL